MHVNHEVVGQQVDDGDVLIVKESNNVTAYRVVAKYGGLYAKDGDIERSVRVIDADARLGKLSYMKFTRERLENATAHLLKALEGVDGDAFRVLTDAEIVLLTGLLSRVDKELL